MFGEHSDFAGRLICDGEGIPEEDVRAVGEANEDTLVGGEVASREVVAFLAALLAEILPEAGLPGFGHDR
jgi:hypothetical protein